MEGLLVREILFLIFFVDMGRKWWGKYKYICIEIYFLFIIIMNLKIIYKGIILLRKLVLASWSLLALASSGAAPRHHVNIH